MWWGAADLDGDVALVTGGGSGLGREIALELARCGCEVVLWGRRLGPLEAVAEEIAALARGRRARVAAVDVGDAAAVLAAAERVGRVDVLVNNAGIHHGPDPLFQRDPNETLGLMRTNVLASFWTLRALLPGMVARDHGIVITVGSAAGVVGVAGMGDYCASKWALRGMNEALRMQLTRLRSKVRCMLAAPSYIDTGMFDGVDPGLLGNTLMPILSPPAVAAAVVDAARRGKAELQTPWLVRTSDVLRGTMPTSVFDAITRVLGVQAALDPLARAKL